MLGKLIKYEFRATRRTVLPLLAASLILAVLANFSIRSLGRAHSAFITGLNTVLLTFFGLSVFACLLMSVVVMIQRFQRNLLTDEGYLMFTLPVSIHALLWSKLIVSVVWFAAAGVVTLLSMFTSVVNVDLTENLLQQLGELFSMLPPETLLIALETLLLMLLGSLCTCLVFYGALATGFSFARHKWLLAVLCFFVLCIIGQIFGVSVLSTWVRSSLFGAISEPGGIHSGIAATQSTLLVTSAGTAVYAALLYLLTWFMLRRRLNLE